MDWAHDSVGNLVEAGGRQLFAYRFTCPTCGERVRLRVGAVNRPHFAHYSHSAKPECENYFPSSAVYQVPHSPPPRTERLRTNSLSLGPAGIFLERADGGHLTLHLRLPRLPAGLEVAGEVQIQTGLGQRTYSSDALKRPQFLRVSARRPIVEASGSGDLEEVASAVEDVVSGFRSTDNFFRASTESGRLLAHDEPLELGEVYRIVTQQPLRRVPSGLRFELLTQSATTSWYFYETTLPTLATDDARSIGQLREFFGREIRKATGRIFVVDPLPHHVEPDGTWVYPEMPPRLLLRNDSDASVVISGSGINAEANIQSLRPGWSEVHGLSTGEVYISIEGRVQVVVRADRCDVFRPQGVKVILEDKTWDLFDPGLRPAVKKNGAASIAIEAEFHRLAAEIEADSKGWSKRGSRLTWLRNERPTINGRNFGELVWNDLEESPPESVDDVDVAQLARRAWVSAVVIRACGVSALPYLEECWRKQGSVPGAAFLGPNGWLWPYIRNSARSGGLRK